MQAKTGAGILFVTATPIGNLADITLRALDTLRAVDCILAEDTRRTKILLRHYGIKTRVQSFHAHNEDEQLQPVLRALLGGARIALLSDAGTPLISDPGFGLVRAARERGICVTPLPGACAAVAALCASGVPAAKFCFEGFLPAKAEARRKSLHALRFETRALIFYESGRRVTATLQAMRESFGGAREVSVAREMSKTFESFTRGSLDEVTARINSDARHRKGEFVIVVRGAGGAAADVRDARAEQVMEILLAELPPRRAGKIAAQLFGGSSRKMYETGLRMKNAK